MEVKTINGYSIKDETARNQLLQHEADLNDIKSNLKFHSIAKSSATYIVEFPNGKNMIVDTGQSTQWSDIKTAIDNLGITKFDYMILTHFHVDHIGNIQNLINNYDLSECICWVQMKPDYVNHAEDIGESETDYDVVIDLLNVYNLNPTVPVNDSYYTIDENTKLHFLNTDSSLTDDYYNQYPEYYNEKKASFNFFSLVTELIFKKTRFLLTGDSERITEEKITPFLDKCDLITIPHHGVNRDAYKTFYYTTSPKYAIGSYITDNDNWVTNAYKSVMYLKELNSTIITPIWSNGTNNIFTFISDGSTVSSNINSNFNDSNLKYPRVYANVAELVNYASEQNASVTLIDIINNMIDGSILKAYWWGNTTYPQVYSDIQAIFPNFTGNCVIEIYKSYNSSYKTIKIIYPEIEYMASYINGAWTKKIGKGFIESANNSNLISKLKSLPKGKYIIEYFNNSDTTVLASGGYVVDVDIISNDDTNILANLLANLRSTTASDSTCITASAYVNTESTPQISWRKLN